MGESIDTLNESNRGGSSNFLLYADITKINLEAFPNENEGNISDGIPFLDEEDGFSRIVLTKDTFSFHESEQKDGSWLTKMIGIIPKDRPELVALFQKQRQKRFIVVFPDNNSQAIIIGNAVEYCKMEVLERSSKESPIERNEYEIIFKCLRRNPSPFYQGTLASKGGDIIFQGATINNLAQVLNKGNDGGGKQIKNIADPSADQDAVTKKFFEENLPETPNLEQVLVKGSDANGMIITGLKSIEEGFSKVDVENAGLIFNGFGLQALNWLYRQLKIGKWEYDADYSETFTERSLVDKEYVDLLVTGLWDDRGNHDASGNAYPSSGGSGTEGAILKGDIWTISAPGTLPTEQVVETGDTVRALIDTPGQTQSNWAIAQNNIGYVAENSANKTDTIVGNEGSSTKYPSTKGVADYMEVYIEMLEINFNS